jgi:hypothetical protein
MATGDEFFPTFDQPVHFSDIILEVEERRFHVHKAILTQWSPVFNVMLTSDFKERSDDVIRLPDKKACDVLELLQVLYPPEKPIDLKNVEIILCLAREYQMQSITNRCEKFLLTTVVNALGKVQTLAKVLTLADTFQLQQVC